jgi:hypothetical protein
MRPALLAAASLLSTLATSTHAMTWQFITDDD